MTCYELHDEPPFWGHSADRGKLRSPPSNSISPIEISPQIREAFPNPPNSSPSGHGAHISPVLPLRNSCQPPSELGKLQAAKFSRGTSIPGRLSRFQPRFLLHQDDDLAETGKPLRRPTASRRNSPLSTEPRRTQLRQQWISGLGSLIPGCSRIARRHRSPRKANTRGFPP